MKWIFPEKQNNDLIEHLFESRKITNRELFLNPKFENLSSPFNLFGVQEGVKVVQDAIKNKKKIFIHGDFDVDGITATSIMWNFLYKDLKADVLPFIPNRFTDGYGLNEENIKNIIQNGGNLIITVDCGIKDIELVNKYSDQIDFIITDHHQIRTIEDGLPEGARQVGDFIISSKAKAVIHPLLSSQSEFKEICGALVSWKFCAGINDFLQSGVDMSKYLDLASLGTVCDVMPLVEENRIVVALGLKQMQRTENLGLKALAQVSAVDLKKSDTYTLGFAFGPRLNASGRMESAMDGVRLLTTDSWEFALSLAKKLNDLNLQRQELTKKYLEIAENILIRDLGANLHNKIYFLYGEDWPEGIVGLIAGKLTEKYNKPVLVGSLSTHSDGKRVIKGSARSIPSFNIAEALKGLGHLLNKHGGHSQAAGFSLDEDSYGIFLNHLTDYANQKISDDDLEKSLKIDYLAKTSDFTIDYAKLISSFSPFGSYNPTPLLALKDVGISRNYKIIGKDQNHLKFTINGSNFECLAFNFNRNPDTLLSSKSNLDLAGNIEVNEWNGRQSLVFKVKEFRESK